MLNSGFTLLRVSLMVDLESLISFCTGFSTKFSFDLLVAPNSFMHSFSWFYALFESILISVTIS